MATVVTEPVQWKGRPKKGSQWDQYLDGQVWALKHGEDFACQPRCAQTSIGNLAQKRGIKVRTRTDGNGIVYVQRLSE